MKYFYLGVLVSCLFLSTASSDGSVYCQGKINKVYITSNGNVVIYGDYLNNYTQICSLNSTWNNVDTMTCASWLALAKTAVTERSDVIVYYANESSCTSIPTYENSPAPYYFMLYTTTP